MKNKKILIWGLLVILWMFFIFFMSSFDSNKSDNQSKGIVISSINKIDEVTGASKRTIEWHHTEQFIDNANYFFRKASHAFVYLILAIFLMRFFNLFDKYSLWQLFLFSVGICFIYACTDEIHQMFISGRTGKFSDVLIDSSGSSIGCIFYVICSKIKMQRKK